MTNQQVLDSVRKHRRAAVYGGAVGLAVVLGLLGWQVIERLLTPAVPNVPTAAQTEIVAFVGDPRGLARLSDVEQEQFLIKWKQNVMADAKRRDELRTCFEGLDPEARRAFLDNVMAHIKKAFIEDARRYQTLPSAERFKYLKGKVEGFSTDALFMKDAIIAFKSDMDTSPDSIQKWILEHTTAEERAIGEPYVNALRDVQLQIKKQGLLGSVAPPKKSEGAPSP